MGRRKVLKEGIHVIFRAEREAYEKFKEICYEKLGVSPSHLFRAFMESIVKGKASIVITRRPVQTAISVTRAVEEHEMPFDVGGIILKELIMVAVSDIRKAIEGKASPLHVREIRDQLINLCGKVKSLDPTSLEQVKQVLAEARAYLKE